MFDWLFAEESRLWVLLLASIIGVFLIAAASMLELFWEVALSVVVGLVVAAQYGFFIATIAFTTVFIGAYGWGGRKVRVHPKHLVGP
jgi:hypothetical protein